MLCDEWTSEGQKWRLEDKLEVYKNTTMVDWDVMVTVVGEKWLDPGHVWKVATDFADIVGKGCKSMREINNDYKILGLSNEINGTVLH